MLQWFTSRWHNIVLSFRKRNEKHRYWTEHIFKFITLKIRYSVQEKTCKFILTDQILHLSRFDLNGKLSFEGINKWMREKLLPTETRECLVTNCKLFEVGFQGHLRDLIFFFFSVLKTSFTSRLNQSKMTPEQSIFFSISHKLLYMTQK